MRRWWRGLVALVAALALTTAGAAVAGDRLLLPSGDGQVLTLLLLGSDEGPPRSTNPVPGRADGFQLLFVSPDRQHATFVSIPRDSYVPVAGRGTTRINACLVDGPSACVATVEHVFGVQVDGYLLTSMEGFKSGDPGLRRPRRERPHPGPGRWGRHPRGRRAAAHRQPGADLRPRPQEPPGRGLHPQPGPGGAARDRPPAGGPQRRRVGGPAGGRHPAAAHADRPQRPAARAAGDGGHAPPPENVQRALAPGSHGMAGAAAIVRLQPQAYEIIKDAAADGRLG
jgi:hypothetical protein